MIILVLHGVIYTINFIWFFLMFLVNQKTRVEPRIIYQPCCEDEWQLSSSIPPGPGMCGNEYRWGMSGKKYDLDGNERWWVPGFLSGYPPEILSGSLQNLVGMIIFWYGVHSLSQMQIVLMRGGTGDELIEDPEVLCSIIH